VVALIIGVGTGTLPIGVGTGTLPLHCLLDNDLGLLYITCRVRQTQESIESIWVLASDVPTDCASCVSPVYLTGVCVYV